MDNSLKVLIGVLSVAGILAFLAPTSVTLPKPQEAPAPVAAVPVVATPVGDQNAGAAMEEEPTDDPEEEEFFKFGEPTIDGKPFTGGDDDPGDSDNSDSQNETSETDPVNEPSDEDRPPNFLPQNTGQ